MKANWKIRRLPEDLAILEEYLEKTPKQQERRELTMLVQEAAFAKGIELFHIRDLNHGSQDFDFGWDLPHAQAIVFLGMVVKDPFLLSRQSVPGNKTGLYSIAALQVENYLWEFAGILELQGYQVQKMVANTRPDFQFAKALANSGRGMVGKNGRYLIGDFGCKICLGYLVTDAPLQGDDYRDTQVVLTNPCQSCTVCLDVRPSWPVTSTKTSAWKDVLPAWNIARHPKLDGKNCLVANYDRL